MGRLTDIYNRWISGEITEDEAAAAFGLAGGVKSLRLITDRSSDLAERLKLLDELEEGSISIADVAHKWGCGKRNVSAAMTRWGVVAPLREWKLRQYTAPIEKDMRRKFALDYIYGENAILCAKRAEITTRALYAWAEKMLVPFSITNRELRSLKQAERIGLGDQVAKYWEIDREAETRAWEIARDKTKLVEYALDKVRSDGPTLAKRVFVDEEAVNRILSPRGTAPVRDKEGGYHVVRGPKPSPEAVKHLKSLEKKSRAKRSKR